MNSNGGFQVLEKSPVRDEAMDIQEIRKFIAGPEEAQEGKSWREWDQ